MLVIRPVATDAKLRAHHVRDQLFLAIEFERRPGRQAGEVQAAQLSDHIAGAQTPGRWPQLVVENGAVIGSRSVRLIGFMRELDIPVHPPAGMSHRPEHHPGLTVGHPVRVRRREGKLLHDQRLPAERVAETVLQHSVVHPCLSGRPPMLVDPTTGCGHPFRKPNANGPYTTLHQFLECADLDAGKVYVNVIVYADESGTHDPAGKQPYSSITIVAGYAAFGDSWDAFARKWHAALDKYHGMDRERYFHFSEFANVKNRSKDPTWLWYGWSPGKRHDYLMELAAVAGDLHGVLIAGALNNPSFHAKMEAVRLESPKLSKDEASKRVWIKQFFLSFYLETRRCWPSLSAPIHFVFDQSEDREWKRAIIDVYDDCRKGDRRFVGVDFWDKKLYVPLQAADMVAYRLRQTTEHAVTKGALDDFSELDSKLFKRTTERLVALKMFIGE